ncbi:hypothetical protein FSW04_20125 [Baekduia soli]|uniref:Uncharacterized protein n=1 Tax=Baekduia soli TaxID=496014 RepID=A0A5B8U9G2_9ACTN|nr:hypothetical protein [Baekduia soli]QEC49655.1 hypothetical protein FSW04_20125 [Baekduia soli]
MNDSHRSRRGLTRDDLDRAARVVQAIAAFPAMSEGVVGFGAHGLDGGYWLDGINNFVTGIDEIEVAIPDRAGTDLAACWQAVLAAVSGHRAEVELRASDWMAREHRQTGRAEAEIADEQARMRDLAADLTVVDAVEPLLCPW